MYRAGRLPKNRDEVWDAQTDINLKTACHFYHFALLVIEKSDKGSVVVNTSSLAELRYINKPYAAT